MAVDPSIALNANAPQPPNALAQIGQFAQTGNALYQNALMGQQLRARRAIGSDYADSIDPTTGQLDPTKLMQNVANDPNAAFMAGDVAQQALERQKDQLQIGSAQLGLQEQKSAAFDNAITPLLRLGSNVTSQDVYSRLAAMKAQGLPIDGALQNVMTTMPTLDPSQAGNPQAKAAYGNSLQGWLFNTAAPAWGAQIGVSMSTPHVQSQDLGGTIRQIDTNPFTNQNLLSGGEDANRTLSPSEQTDQVKITDGKGNIYSLPRSTVANMQGQGNLIPPGNSPGAAGGVFGSGRYGQPPPSLDTGGGASPFDGGSGAGAPFAMSSGSPFGGPARTPPGALRAGLGPAGQAAQTQVGAQAAGEAGALFNQAQGVPDRKAMLSDMESDLANAPTGPGAQNQAYWSAFANNHFGNLSRLLPGVVQNPGQVASFENFEKMAGRFAQNQAGSLGAVTNDKLSSAMASNPNTVFSTLGNQGVIHILQGNEDAIAAKNTAWQNYVGSGGDPSSYQQWSTQFNNSGFDPRVFWMKNMTPTERNSYISTLTPSQAKTFYGNVRTGMANQWVSPSDFMSGSGQDSAQGSPSPAGAQPVPQASAPVANPANGY